ncbi:hypothetical protein Hypma_006897 [Hypsizygus marmoreus]|uniref:Uncharacterized protein n=1 Tax=Hypsizygus marmoreus TaxID=39966 RepID=A0A369JWF5_HYPMA|nr:hypothetical protein Hypma_006897 [Hypsizygus marmoreus]
MLFSCLGPQDLTRFSLTGGEVYDAATSYIDRAFNIYDLLSRYFSSSETTQFRTLQAMTGTLISGSAAVEFFARARFSDADLDLYVEYRHAALLGEWLVDTGYKFVARPHQNARFPDVINNLVAQGSHLWDLTYTGHGITGVYAFIKERPYRKIEIVASANSAIELVLDFHSST